MAVIRNIWRMSWLPIQLCEMVLVVSDDQLGVARKVDEVHGKFCCRYDHGCATVCYEEFLSTAGKISFDREIAIPRFEYATSSSVWPNGEIFTYPS